MTREEALNKAIGVLTYNQVNFCKSKEAFANMNEIIEALEKIDQEPNYNSVKTELEPCDDAVSKQAVLDGLASIAKVKAKSDAQKSLMGRVMFFVEKLPSVTPQPKMGRWIKTPKAVMGEGYIWYCDKCEHKVYQDSSKPYPSEKYCPNCGQPKMQEVEGC